MRETGQPSTGAPGPVFDREDFQRRIGLPDEMLGEFLKAYLDDATEGMQRLDAAIEARDRDGVHHGAHSLKGSSGNMSMIEMQRLGADIEQQAAQASWDELRAAVGRLRQALDRVRALAASLT